MADITVAKTIPPFSPGCTEIIRESGHCVGGVGSFLSTREPVATVISIVFQQLRFVHNI